MRSRPSREDFGGEATRLGKACLPQPFIHPAFTHPDFFAAVFGHVGPGDFGRFSRCSDANGDCASAASGLRLRARLTASRRPAHALAAIDRRAARSPAGPNPALPTPCPLPRQRTAEHRRDGRVRLIAPLTVARFKRTQQAFQHVNAAPRGGRWKGSRSPRNNRHRYPEETAHGDAPVGRQRQRAPCPVSPPARSALRSISADGLTRARQKDPMLADHNAEPRQARTIRWLQNADQIFDGATFDRRQRFAQLKSKAARRACQRRFRQSAQHREGHALLDFASPANPPRARRLESARPHRRSTNRLGAERHAASGALMPPGANRATGFRPHTMSPFSLSEKFVVRRLLQRRDPPRDFRPQCAPRGGQNGARIGSKRGGIGGEAKAVETAMMGWPSTTTAPVSWCRQATCLL